MRLFVALDLPQSHRDRLSDLASGLPGARWVPPENYHVTLRFVGEVPPHEAEELDLALAGIRARRFALELAGVGTFDRGGRSGTLFAGVARNDGLAHLQSKVETALQRAGVAPERRRFTPHVALAKLDGSDPRLGGWIAAHNLFRAPAIAVEHFCLFSSHLGREQASYTVEVEYALE